MAAFVADLVLYGLALSIVDGLTKTSGGTSGPRDPAVVWLWLPLVYFAGSWALGGTVGQRVFGLAVLSETGGPLSLPRAAWRFVLTYLLFIASVISFGLASVVFLLVAARGGDLLPNDRLSGARVVRREIVAAPIAEAQLFQPSAAPEQRGFSLLGSIARLAMFASLAVVILGVCGIVLLVSVGFGDSYTTLEIQNGSEQELGIAIRYLTLPSATEGVPRSLRPGEETTWQRIGAPREQPRFRIRAFDSSGSVVYCHEVSYEEWQTLSPVRGSPRPLVVRPGEISCRDPGR